MKEHSVYSYALLLLTFSCVSSTYISWKSGDGKVQKKTNDNSSPSKRYGPPFKSDWDISRYLKLYGEEMMLWRCKNAIQPYWDWKPLPVVELYCEAIGRLKSVDWYHNGHKLHIGGRYGQLIVPHYANGKYFAKWIDFRLKIYNATMRDSGVYTFRAKSPSGQTEEQIIYVDISEKKKKRKRDREHRERRRKLRGKSRDKFIGPK